QVILIVALHPGGGTGLAEEPALPSASEPDDPMDTSGSFPLRPACFRRRLGAIPAAPVFPLPPTPLPKPSLTPLPAPPPVPDMGSTPTGDTAEPPPTFTDLAAGAGVGSNVALDPGGYIDSAIPRTRFRVRYDIGFDMNRPDRAEYFYAAWRE